MYASGSLRMVDNRTGAERTISDSVTIATDGAGSAVRGSLARAGRVSVTELPLEHDYKELHIPPRAGEYALQPDALHVWPRHGFMLIALPNPDRSFTATLFLPQTGDPGFDTLNSDAAVQEFFHRRVRHRRRTDSGSGRAVPRPSAGPPRHDSRRPVGLWRGAAAG